MLYLIIFLAITVIIFSAYLGVRIESIKEKGIVESFNLGFLGAAPQQPRLPSDFPVDFDARSPPKVSLPSTPTLSLPSPGFTPPRVSLPSTPRVSLPTPPTVSLPTPPRVSLPTPPSEGSLPTPPTVLPADEPPTVSTGGGEPQPPNMNDAKYKNNYGQFDRNAYEMDYKLYEQERENWDRQQVALADEAAAVEADAENARRDEEAQNAVQNIMTQLETNKGGVATNVAGIATNATGIARNVGNIGNNRTDINQNISSRNDITGRLQTIESAREVESRNAAEAKIAATAASTAASSGLKTLQDSLTKSYTTGDDQVRNALESRLSSNESNQDSKIAALESKVDKIAEEVNINKDRTTLMTQTDGEQLKNDLYGRIGSAQDSMDIKRAKDLKAMRSELDGQMRKLDDGLKVAQAYEFDPSNLVTRDSLNEVKAANEDRINNLTNIINETNSTLTAGVKEAKEAASTVQSVDTSNLASKALVTGLQSSVGRLGQDVGNLKSQMRGVSMGSAATTQRINDLDQKITARGDLGIYAKKSDLDNYAKLDDVNNEMRNAGYLTKSALDGYVTTGELGKYATKDALTAVSAVDTSKLATKAELGNYVSKIDAGNKYIEHGEPITIASHRTKRRLSEVGRRGQHARFQNHNRNVWEKMYIEKCQDVNNRWVMPGATVRGRRDTRRCNPR